MKNHKITAIKSRGRYFHFAFFWGIPAEKKKKKLESPDLQSPMVLCRALYRDESDIVS